MLEVKKISVWPETLKISFNLTFTEKNFTGFYNVNYKSTLKASAV